MTTELTYLALTLILALVQVFLPAGARTVEFGSKWNAGPRDETPAARKPLTGRLERAQANLFETLPIFAAAVIMAHIAGKDGALTALGAHLYFFGRLIYLPLYAFGVHYLRSLVWLVAAAGLVMVLVAPFL